MGAACSCVGTNVKDRFDLQPFVMRRLPIFWLMGPYGCGKMTTACMLKACCNYHVVRAPDLIREELGKGKARAKIIEQCQQKDQPVPDSIIITLLKEHIFLHYSNSKGFIFVGFPIHAKQAKLFEAEICKVNVVIHCTLVLDCFLGRMITKLGDINTEEMRKKFVRSQKLCNEIQNIYSSKTIVVSITYPPENALNKLIDSLEENYGYKFDKIYNAN